MTRWREYLATFTTVKISQLHNKFAKVNYQILNKPLKFSQRLLKFHHSGKISANRAGALFQRLWEETRVPKVVGSNPSTEWTFFHIYLLLELKCLFEKTIKNEKEAGDGLYKNIGKSGRPANLSASLLNYFQKVSSHPA